MSNLTIVDLHQEEELSSSALSKVAGGMYDTFLNFDDIKGESTGDKHKDWIAGLDYSAALKPPGTGIAKL